PSQYTKHLPTLQCGQFNLKQSDDGRSNGTALWLGAQVLTAYLTAANLPPGRAIELGSGIGLTALTLGSQHWSVVATDLPFVIDTVLRPNIVANGGNDRVTVRHLDWTCPIFTDEDEYDLILTADTIYDSTTIRPLLDTIHALTTRSPRALLLVCLERRDPSLVEKFFDQAMLIGFVCEQIPARKLSKALKKSGASWTRDDWDGVELWRLKL
ncbi:hypothetical protein CYLTODRAFT_320136, partial [Cylindrobasidium torrendii FP15055 ss-10]